MHEMQPRASLVSTSKKISRIANRWELGELRANFSPQLKDRRTWSHLSEMLRDVGNMSAGIIIVLLILSRARILVESNSVFFVVMALLGILMIILNGISLVHLVWHISAWERGLIVKKSWHPLQIIFWDEIESSSRAFSCTIRRKDGFEIQMNKGICNIEGLACEVEEQVKARLLPKALADYEAGKTLTFDTLNMNKEGLGLPDETIPWHRIKDINTQFTSDAALISIATSANAVIRPLQIEDVQMMLRTARRKKNQAMLRTSNYLLLAGFLFLPNLPIALSLIEHAHTSHE